MPRGNFKDEWEHKAYFVLFFTLNVSGTKLVLEMKWRNDFYELQGFGFGFCFFFIHTSDRTKTFRGRQPNVM